MKTFSISISGNGIPETALETNRSTTSLQRALTKGRAEFVMTRAGDNLEFKIVHPEGDVSNDDYAKYITRLEKKLGDLQRFVESNARSIAW